MAQLPLHPTSYPTIKIPRRDLADALLQVGLRLRLSKLRFQCNGRCAVTVVNIEIMVPFPEVLGPSSRLSAHPS
jgi:hypothetical protein